MVRALRSVAIGAAMLALFLGMGLLYLVVLVRYIPQFWREWRQGIPLGTILND